MEFDYSPGVAGNARQYCNECRGHLDNEEIEEFKERLIRESNKLNEERYDPIDILIDGNMPDFASDLERFLCTREIAFFVRKTGMTGMEDNLLKFFDELQPVHIAIFLKQQKLDTLTAISKDARFKKIVDMAIKWV